MYPIGTYDRFVQKIKGREGKGKPQYLGVLFCDIEQENVREYITNYIGVFNEKSGTHLDFYIPGYLSQTTCTSNMFEFNNEKYSFNRNKYNEFCQKFSQDFDIQFPYVPTLVLLEYKNGNFKMTKRSVFNLEDIKGGVKNAGYFFDLIFKSAEENNELQHILKDMLKNVDKKPELLFTLINQISSFFNLDFNNLKDKLIECNNNRKQYTLK